MKNLIPDCYYVFQYDSETPGLSSPMNKLFWTLASTKHYKCDIPLLFFQISIVLVFILFISEIKGEEKYSVK